MQTQGLHIKAGKTIISFICFLLISSCASIKIGANQDVLFFKYKSNSVGYISEVSLYEDSIFEFENFYDTYSEKIVGKYWIRDDTLFFKNNIEPLQDTILFTETKIDSIPDNCNIIVLKGKNKLSYWTVNVNNFKEDLEFFNYDTIGYVWKSCDSIIRNNKYNTNKLTREICINDNTIKSFIIQNIGIKKCFIPSSKNANFFEFFVTDIYADSLRYNKRFVIPEKWLIRSNSIIDPVGKKYKRSN